MNPYIEQQIWVLIEKVANLEASVRELQKQVKASNKDNQHEIKEILFAMNDAKSKISEFAESINGFAEWKSWIDKIIAKIKKLLPI